MISVIPVAAYARQRLAAAPWLDERVSFHEESPIISAGVSDHVWSLEEVIDLMR
jgi:hypothetical protein